MILPAFHLLLVSLLGLFLSSTEASRKLVLFMCLYNKGGIPCYHGDDDSPIGLCWQLLSCCGQQELIRVITYSTSCLIRHCMEWEEM